MLTLTFGLDLCCSEKFSKFKMEVDICTDSFDFGKLGAHVTAIKEMVAKLQADQSRIQGELGQQRKEMNLTRSFVQTNLATAPDTTFFKAVLTDAEEKLVSLSREIGENEVKLSKMWTRMSGCIKLIKKANELKNWHKSFSESAEKLLSDGVLGKAGVEMKGVTPKRGGIQEHLQDGHETVREDAARKEINGDDDDQNRDELGSALLSGFDILIKEAKTSHEAISRTAKNLTNGQIEMSTTVCSSRNLEELQDDQGVVERGRRKAKWFNIGNNNPKKQSNKSNLLVGFSLETKDREPSCQIVKAGFEQIVVVKSETQADPMEIYEEMGQKAAVKDEPLGADHEPTPRKQGRPSKNAKGVKGHMKEKCKHVCPKCKQRYATRAVLNIHMYACTFCEKCKRWVDKRHLLTCSGKGKKSPQILCNLCHRFRSKGSMGRHMASKHGVTKWRRSEHPECLSEDEYFADVSHQTKLDHLEEEKARLVRENELLQRQLNDATVNTFGSGDEKSSFDVTNHH